MLMAWPTILGQSYEEWTRVVMCAASMMRPSDEMSENALVSGIASFARVISALCAVFRHHGQ